MILDVHDVSVSLQQHQILHNIYFQADNGQFIGLIGPNGSGKSTLIKAIANLLSDGKQQIKVDGKPLASYSDKQLAQMISYVPQHISTQFDFSVEDIVAMGRYVYTSRFQTLSNNDHAIIQQAMEQTNTAQLAKRSILNLSGGQRQLVFIARALAQQTPIILLDEPISALDIHYQLHVLSLLKQLAQSGKTILIVIHDLNLAARYCDRLLLLAEGKVVKFGQVEDVLQAEQLNETYQVETKIAKNLFTGSVDVTPLLNNKEGERKHEESYIY